jgi:hypothetical protein
MPQLQPNVSPSSASDQIAEAIQALAIHVKYLGTGDAATTMGAVEFLAMPSIALPPATRKSRRRFFEGGGGDSRQSRIEAEQH